MGKRTKMVIKTKEADALKRLRIINGLSVRKLADMMGLSHTMVNHLELGRANIGQEYIKKCLMILNYNKEDWEILTGGQTKRIQADETKTLEECIRKLRTLSKEKLKLVQSFLANL
jgi:transcriptional regulator with XRE-family HTH domain